MDFAWNQQSNASPRHYFEGIVSYTFTKSITTSPGSRPLIFDPSYDAKVHYTLERQDLYN